LERIFPIFFVVSPYYEIIIELTISLYLIFLKPYIAYDPKKPL